MKVIRPNCRAQFTAADFDFMISVLPGRDKNPNWLFKLLEDPETRDVILDDGHIVKAVLELRRCLSVSMHFYFYVLVRNAFRKAGLEDRELADYVAELLAEFSLLPRVRQPNPSDPRPMDYLFEMLSEADNAGGEDRFLWQAHVGNYSLFLAGGCPRHLEYRIHRRAAPGFQYYEELGSAHFRMASDHPLARKFELTPILFSLGQSFHLTRLALNDLSERLVFLESNRAVENLLADAQRPSQTG